jgi:predicted nucleic acid-binding protein
VILVDTSVWVDHLRQGAPQLAAALNRLELAIHPWVIGELACGHLHRREEVPSLLTMLPALPVALDEEVLQLVEGRALMGRGIGYLDAHLLAACLLARARLWTRDRRLRQMAEDFGVGMAMA